MAMIDVGFIPFSSLNAGLSAIAENEYEKDVDYTKSLKRKDTKKIRVETVYNEQQLVLNIYEGETEANPNDTWYKNLNTMFNTLLSPMVQSIFEQYKDMFEKQVSEIIMSSLGGVS